MMEMITINMTSMELSRLTEILILLCTRVALYQCNRCLNLVDGAR